MGSRWSNWFHDTVSALAYSLAERHAASGDPVLQPPHNDLAQFILRQQARLPDYLRGPMRAATLGFDLTGLLRGRRFHTQRPEQRHWRIAAWKLGAWGPQRDLIRFHESLVTLALYDRLTITAEESYPAALPAKSIPTFQPALGQPLCCDIAVVGSGPGGAITACLLAEAGREVCLIEEGPFLPLDSCRPFSRMEMEQKYRHGGLTVAWGADKIAYVEGRCVGGGSEINSGLYHRTPPEILARWRREFLVEALMEKDLAPLFALNERDLSVSKLTGPAPAASMKLHDGAMHLGWRSLEVPRWFRPAETGSDSHSATVKTADPRQSMTATFIPRFLKAGGKLLAETRVIRLRSEGQTWVLQAQGTDGAPREIHAGTVFLCAGAVQTPALLRRSGITQHIGNALRMHPTLKLVAKFPTTVNSAAMGVPVHQVKEFAPRLTFGCSISSPAYLALGLLEHPSHGAEVSRTWPYLANYYAMITGDGSGHVRELPRYRDPLVRYTLTDRDRRDLADGWRKLATALFAAGADTIFPCVTGSAPLRHPDALRQIPESLPVGAGNLMTIHLFSSCPMGEDRKRCATDSFGRLHGFTNLRINDASLLCTAPGVNPQGTIMALARRNVLQFLGHL